LVEDDTVIVDGVLTTSLARTVLDLSRTIRLQAVAAGDRALATGLTDADLSVVLARMERWPGVRRARVAASMLDARSESPGESFSRVELVRQEQQPQAPKVQRLQENRDDVVSGAAGEGGGGGGGGGASAQPGNPNQVISDKTPRNAPCPCGSGLKYKKCHGAAA